MTTKGDIRLIKRHAKFRGKDWRPALAVFRQLSPELQAAIRAEMKADLGDPAKPREEKPN